LIAHIFHPAAPDIRPDNTVFIIFGIWPATGFDCRIPETENCRIPETENLPDTEIRKLSDNRPN
jgi:ribonuclease I